MLLRHLWLLSLATLGNAAENWEINSAEGFDNEQDPGPATYFFDPTCTQQNKNLVEVIEEVKVMGTEGFKAMKDNSADMRLAYQRLFKLLPEANIDLKEKRVMRVFHRIGGMVQTDNRADADIRIHCDNDESTLTIQNPDPNNPPRWVPAPDEWYPMGPMGDGTPNSQQGFEDQIFHDRLNLIYRTQGYRGVQPGHLFGATYSELPRALQTAQNPHRAATTIADVAFAHPAMLAYLDVQDIFRANIEHLGVLQSLTLFHELCHAPTILGIENDDELYGWIDMEKEQNPNVVAETCDSYAFLGLVALLNRQGARIAAAPSTQLISSNPVSQVNKIKRSGLYTRYEISDRSLFTGTSTTSPKRAFSFNS